MVAVSAISADTGEEAERLAASMRMAITLLRAGSSIAIPTPEKALEFLRVHPSPQPLPVGRRAIIGDAPRVRAGLEDVAREYGAEEVMVVTITHDHVARVHSYELLADAFGLAERAPASDFSSRATQAA